MKLDLYQIDAFTDSLFKGNPACVVPMEEFLNDEVLLNIAKENAVAETSFIVIKEDRVLLRWFTPELEMDLCGHATLAAAHALKTILNYPENPIVFDTQSGILEVNCEDDGYTLNFPTRKAIPAKLPKLIKDSLNILPSICLQNRDYVLVYDSEEEIRKIEINRSTFDQINLGTGGVIVTAKGKDCDFVSRFFSPQASILEDPVTGSAHCSLIPYWSGVLKKKKLSARQLSERGGTLFCVDLGEKVLISGKARTYSIGTLFTE